VNFKVCRADIVRHVVGNNISKDVIFLFVLLPLSAALMGIVIGASLVGVLVYWAQRRLGGQTGDVLGAAQQLIEIAVLVAAAGWSASY